MRRKQCQPNQSGQTSDLIRLREYIGEAADQEYQHVEGDDPGPSPKEAPPEATSREALLCVMRERLAVDPCSPSVGSMGYPEEKSQQQPQPKAS